MSEIEREVDVERAVEQADVDAQAGALLDGAPEGEELDELTGVFVRLALSASAMVLDREATLLGIARATDLGATPDQIQELFTVVSGMGVHTFFEATRLLDDAVSGGSAHEPSNSELWERYVGDGAYWLTMNEEIPGFLSALERRSPEAYQAFFDYCAVPWKTRYLPSLTKELVSAAADAMPAHRYLPGMRLHIRNALAIGAGRRQVLDALAIAAEIPLARGIR